MELHVGRRQTKARQDNIRQGIRCRTIAPNRNCGRSRKNIDPDQVMLDEARTPQEKLDVVTQALTFADDRQKGEGNACGVQQFQGVPAV